MGKALALHMTNLGSISGILYGCSPECYDPGSDHRVKSKLIPERCQVCSQNKTKSKGSKEDSTGKKGSSLPSRPSTLAVQKDKFSQCVTRWIKGMLGSSSKARKF